MPIPWLIGGAVVAAAAAVTAVVASDSNSSSSSSGAKSAAKARDMERERSQELKRASKAEWLNYSNKLLKNLAVKYQFPDDAALRPYLLPRKVTGSIKDMLEISIGGIEALGVKISRDLELLEKSALYQKYTTALAELDEELSELEDAWLTLEDIDAQFR